MEEEEKLDVGDEEVVKKKKTARELRRERELREIQILLENPDNRYFVWRILSQCGLFDSMSWAQPHEMAVLSGKRDIGLWILGEVFDADPTAFTKMQAEAPERDKRK